MSRRTDVQEKLPDGKAMWLLSSILEALASRKQGTHIDTLIIIIIIIIVVVVVVVVVD
jgi:t-SNARE complex subunit (syntaxin)